MAELKYADIFSQHIIDMYAVELKSNGLFQSNSDIQIVNGKQLKLPKLTVSGYQDHNRTTAGFNAGSYDNDYEVKVLDHDRDIEFAVDPMDVDETNMTVSIANIQKRFEITQAIPELDCYTFSKIFTEAQRVGASVETTALTADNVLEDFDNKVQLLEDAGVPMDRMEMYVTPAYNKLLAENGLKSTQSMTDDIPNRQITVADIKYINMDETTYVYITDENGNVYKQDFSENEELIFIQSGDKIKVFYQESDNGINDIISVER
jgi:hypothetical protein